MQNTLRDVVRKLQSGLLSDTIDTKIECLAMEFEPSRLSTEVNRQVAGKGNCDHCGYNRPRAFPTQVLRLETLGC